MDSHPTSCFKAPSPITWCPMESSTNVSSISSLIPSIILIIRSWHTQAGERAVGQAGRAVQRIDAHEKLFKCREAGLPGEQGQLLNTQPEPWLSGSYRVLCIRDTAWILPCRHHIRLEHPKLCVYSPQREHLPLQLHIIDVQPCHHAAWNKLRQTSALDRLWYRLTHCPFIQFQSGLTAVVIAVYTRWKKREMCFTKALKGLKYNSVI